MLTSGRSYTNWREWSSDGKGWLPHPPPVLLTSHLLDLSLYLHTLRTAKLSLDFRKKVIKVFRFIKVQLKVCGQVGLRRRPDHYQFYFPAQQHHHHQHIDQLTPTTTTTTTPTQTPGLVSRIRTQHFILRVSSS